MEFDLLKLASYLINKHQPFSSQLGFYQSSEFTTLRCQVKTFIKVERFDDNFRENFRDWTAAILDTTEY